MDAEIDAEIDVPIAKIGTGAGGTASIEVTGWTQAGQKGEQFAKGDECVLTFGKEASLCLGQTRGFLQGQRGQLTFPIPHSGNEQG